MSDQAVKKRIFRARLAAAENLRRTGYGIISTDGGPFSIIAVRPSEARFIRIVFAKPTTADLKACGAFRGPSGCVCEIWEAATVDGIGTEFLIQNIL